VCGFEILPLSGAFSGADGAGCNQESYPYGQNNGHDAILFPYWKVMIIIFQYGKSTE